MSIDGRGQRESPPSLVYLVDDDLDFREEMVLGLSSLGLDAHGFGSAAALYRAFAAKTPDIVVLDIGLGGEDGLSVASHLRASPTLGIIVASGRGTIEDRVQGLQTGADAYLVKPVDTRELAATVVALNQRLAEHRAPSPAKMAVLDSRARRLGAGRRDGTSPPADHVGAASFGMLVRRTR